MLSTMRIGGTVRLGDRWDVWTRYLYLDRLRDRSVLEQAMLDVVGFFQWTTDGFALARGCDDGGQLNDLWLPGDQPEPSQVGDDMFIVRPGVAIAQRRAETPDVVTTQAGASHSANAPRRAQYARRVDAAVRASIRAGCGAVDGSRCRPEPLLRH